MEMAGNHSVSSVDTKTVDSPRANSQQKNRDLVCYIFAAVGCGSCHSIHVLPGFASVLLRSAILGGSYTPNQCIAHEHRRISVRIVA